MLGGTPRSALKQQPQQRGFNPADHPPRVLPAAAVGSSPRRPPIGATSPSQFSSTAQPSVPSQQQQPRSPLRTTAALPPSTSPIVVSPQQQTRQANERNSPYPQTNHQHNNNNNNVPSGYYYDDSQRSPVSRGASASFVQGNGMDRSGALQSSPAQPQRTLSPVQSAPLQRSPVATAASWQNGASTEASSSRIPPNYHNNNHNNKQSELPPPRGGSSSNNLTPLSSNRTAEGPQMIPLPTGKNSPFQNSQQQEPQGGARLSGTSPNHATYTSVESSSPVPQDVGRRSEAYYVQLRQMELGIIEKDLVALRATLADRDAVLQRSAEREGQLLSEVQQLKQQLEQETHKSEMLRHEMQKVQESEQRYIVKLDGSSNNLLATQQLCRNYEQDIAHLKLQLKRHADEIRQLDALLTDRNKEISLSMAAKVRSEKLAAAMEEKLCEAEQIQTEQAKLMDGLKGKLDEVTAKWVEATEDAARSREAVRLATNETERLHAAMMDARRAKDDAAYSLTLQAERSKSEQQAIRDQLEKQARSEEEARHQEELTTLRLRVELEEHRQAVAQFVDAIRDYEKTTNALRSDVHAKEQLLDAERGALRSSQDRLSSAEVANRELEEHNALLRQQLQQLEQDLQTAIIVAEREQHLRHDGVQEASRAETLRSQRENRSVLNAESVARLAIVEANTWYTELAALCATQYSTSQKGENTLHARYNHVLQQAMSALEAATAESQAVRDENEKLRIQASVPRMIARSLSPPLRSPLRESSSQRPSAAADGGGGPPHHVDPLETHREPSTSHAASTTGGFATRDAWVRSIMKWSVQTKTLRRKVRYLLNTPSWRDMVKLHTVPDDFGHALCDVVDDFHSLHSDVAKFTEEQLTDAERSQWYGRVAGAGTHHHQHHQDASSTTPPQTGSSELTAAARVAIAEWARSS